MPIEPEELELTEEPEDDEVTIAYDIAAYPSDLTLSVIAEMWKNGDIVIPEFQRNFVWNIRQASLLIESFLLGLPVPQVFFYIDDKSKSLVIDGQQRIMSVVFFMEGYFGTESHQGKRVVFRLQGLDNRNPFHRKRFEDLSEIHQRKLRGAVLRAINIRQLNPTGSPTSIYHIFERLNTGGTPLRPQEIRNCVYRGEMVRILKELNNDSKWRAILGKKTLDTHQKDVELVLRIFSLCFYFDQYEKPMKEFLSKIMAKEQEATSKESKKFADLFTKTAALIFDNLGPKPFHIRGPLNTSVLDTVFCTLLRNIKEVPNDLSKRFAKLVENDRFQSWTSYSTSDVAIVKERFALARDILL